jgi:Eukaryotic aspartyl protease
MSINRVIGLHLQTAALSVTSGDNGEIRFGGINNNFFNNSLVYVNNLSPQFWKIAVVSTMIADLG